MRGMGILWRKGGESASVAWITISNIMTEKDKWLQCTVQAHGYLYQRDLVAVYKLKKCNSVWHELSILTSHKCLYYHCDSWIPGDKLIGEGLALTQTSRFTFCNRGGSHSQQARWRVQLWRIVTPRYAVLQSWITFKNVRFSVSNLSSVCIGWCLEWTIMNCLQVFARAASLHHFLCVWSVLTWLF